MTPPPGCPGQKTAKKTAKTPVAAEKKSGKKAAVKKIPEPRSQPPPAQPVPDDAAAAASALVGLTLTSVSVIAGWNPQTLAWISVAVSPLQLPVATTVVFVLN